MFDLYGQVYSTGGSAGLGVTGGLEFAYGTARNGDDVVTTSISIGVGPIPAELHANFFAGTAVTEIKWKWLYNKIKDLSQSVFDKLSCDQQSAIEDVIGNGW